MEVESYHSTDLRGAEAMRFRTAAVLAACFIGAMIVPAPLGAQAQPTFDYSPTSGPIGTEISMSGVCSNDYVRMFFQRVSDDKVFTSEDFPVDAGGNWSGTVVVPSEAINVGDPTTPGAYELRGDCRSSTDPTLNYLYEFEPFEVTGDGVPVQAKCRGQDATIIGTPGNDSLRGTPGHDVIVGLGGRDLIVGRGGNDLICAGPGRDRVSGGPGGDVIFGQGGNDLLRGNAGNDFLHGGPGRDVCNGGPGRDRARSCETRLNIP